MKKTIVGLSGEHSGDGILKNVVRRLGGDVQVSGLVCAPFSGKEEWLNKTILFNGPKELGVMGLGLDLLSGIPNFALRLHQTTKWVESLNPTGVVTVDAKGFNLRLHNRLSQSPMLRNVTKRIHVCAPSIWAYKDGQKRIENMVSLHQLQVLAPFEKYYWQGPARRHNVKVVGYFGLEPLLDFCGIEGHDKLEHEEENVEYVENHSLEYLLPHETPKLQHVGVLPEIPFKSRQVARTFLSMLGFKQPLEIDDKILLLAPGSRPETVRSSLRVMNSVLCEIYSQSPGAALPKVVVLTPPDTKITELCDDFLRRNVCDGVVVNDNFKEMAYAASTAAIATSGTVVTELLSFGVPSVVIFNAGGPLTKWFAKRLARVEFATLVNITSGRSLVKEFIFDNTKDIKGISRATIQALQSANDEEYWAPIRTQLASLIVWTKDGKPMRPSALSARFVEKELAE